MNFPSVDFEFLSLCLAAATHSFLLFSFFPYAGYMALSLLENDTNDNKSVDGINVDNVGIYAGMLGAAFTVGRFLGFVPWKMCRTRLGEKHALTLSLGLTGLASVWVGLSGSFAEALLARLFQGLANCISGSVKRAAINAQHNRSANGGDTWILWTMWWGTALGPLIGGFLSDPEFLGSHFDLESPSSWYPSHPYLLANGVSGILCWITMLCVVVFAKTPSTVSGGQRTSVLGEHRPLLSPAPARASTAGLRPDHHLRNAFRKLWTTNKDARLHLVAYWSFSFVVVCWDEALPLFLITSGLGLSEGDLGLLLGAAGLIVALGHHHALDNVFDTHNGTPEGMYNVLVACAVVGTLPIVLVYPILGAEEDATGETSREFPQSSFVSLVILVAVLKIAASIYFSVIGRATSRSLRVVHKDEAARIMTIGALYARSLAPIAAGGILSYFMGRQPSAGTTPSVLPSPYNSSLMVWIVIGVVFGGAAVSVTFFLARHSGRGVDLTEKQERYFRKRLERLLSFASLSDSLDKAYTKATQSIFERWNQLISFRLKLNAEAKRRRTSLVAIPNDLFLNAEPSPEAEKVHSPATWEEHTIAPGVDFDSVSFFILGTHKKDKTCAPHVLAPPVMKALQEHLPTNCTESNFWLRYSLLRDGASTHSIEAKAGLARDAVLAIETLDGDVFGSFMTKSWSPTNNQYTRCSDSFLWRLKSGRSTQDKDDEEGLESKASEGESIIEVYPWTGKNDLCQLFANDKIACGGGIVGGEGDGFGILLNEDLLSGSSSPCVTYDNPSLRSSMSSSMSVGSADDKHRFEVANIEVWGLTPFMFVADAERSEYSIQIINENSFGSAGDGGETPSSTSAWSNFM